jgi:hypothetical protein
MKTQSIDTCAEAERVLISLIRKESTSKKLSRILSLSQTIIQLSKRAITRTNRDLDVDQINLLFINYHYGRDLAEQVKKYLDKGRNEKS